MNRPLCLAAAMLALGVLAAPLGAGAAETKPPEKKTDSKPDNSLKFMRVVRDSRDRPLALETATGHYISTSKDKPCTVDLIGAIHVADKRYYEALNERFKHYDAVLFELVMPEGGSLQGLGDRKSKNPISSIQQSLPSILNLDYQLKEIDYTAKNFVHADLSPDAMAKAMKERGDTGTSVVAKVLLDVMRESGKQAAARSKKDGGDFAEIDLLVAMFDSNRPLRLKRLMADQMDVLETGTGLGPTLDTILVKDRNNAAMRVLGQQMKKGVRKIAIFYGAAHMPDFDLRLSQEFKLKRESMTWDRAWDLSSK